MRLGWAIFLLRSQIGRQLDDLAFLASLLRVSPRLTVIFFRFWSFWAATILAGPRWTASTGWADAGRANAETSTAAPRPLTTLRRTVRFREFACLRAKERNLLLHLGRPDGNGPLRGRAPPRGGTVALPAVRGAGQEGRRGGAHRLRPYEPWRVEEVRRIRQGGRLAPLVGSRPVALRSSPGIGGTGRRFGHPGRPGADGPLSRLRGAEPARQEADDPVDPKRLLALTEAGCDLRSGVPLEPSGPREPAERGRAGSADVEECPLGRCSSSPGSHPEPSWWPPPGSGPVLAWPCSPPPPSTWPWPSTSGGAGAARPAPPWPWCWWRCCSGPAPTPPSWAPPTCRPSRAGATSSTSAWCSFRRPGSPSRRCSPDAGRGSTAGTWPCWPSTRSRCWSCW